MPTVAVLDGVTEAMNLLGLEPNSNSDVATFMTRLPRPLAAQGPAVAQIDHQPKSHDNRGRFAIGAQHKLSGLDGAAYVFELKKPFGHGLHGVAQIGVTKDRPGRVREYARGGRVADLHLRSEPDGSVFAEMRPPETSGSDGTFRPTVLMERVSRYLEATAGPRSLRDVQAGVSGKTDAKRTALNCLVDDGYVAREPHGKAHHHTSVRPYRQEPNA